MITSLQNPRVKDAVRLRDGRHRQRQGQILIDGARELARAVAAGITLRAVFLHEPWCQSPAARQLLGVLPTCGVEILEVSAAVFEKLAFGDRAEGLLGVAEMPRPSLEALCPPERPLIAVLEGVEKPGNLGAVLRTADAAGLSAVLVADPRTDLYNPNVIRASLGTIFTMGVAQGTAAEVLAWLRRYGLMIFAARIDGSTLYTAADYRGPAAICLGSEAQGLSAAWSADDIRPIRLPMLGTADSLNVSAAAAALFYEARRQRQGERKQGD